MTITMMRLRGVERQLERLNRNIERLLAHVYDLQPEPPASAKNTGEGGNATPEVLYTNETEDAIREFLEANGVRVPRRGVGEDEEGKD